MRCIRPVLIIALVFACGCYRRSISSTEVPKTDNAANDSALSLPIPDAVVPNGGAANFVNVADAAGITTVLLCGGKEKNHILESVGSGCAWIDYDEDGMLDLFLVNGWALDDDSRQVREKGRNALYHNLGHGLFEHATADTKISSDDWGCGVCAGDFDNDGHVDLYVTNFGENRLYRNLGNGEFEEVALRAGVTSPGWSSGAAFFDADGDDWLDLYVAKYIDCTFEDVLKAKRTTTWQGSARVMAGPFGLRGGRDQFFHNNRDGTFSDATDRAGMVDIAESYGLGVIASDFDGDGDVDVYVANDSNPNFLYRNDGKGIFTETSAWSGAGITADCRAQGSMGVDAADFNGDGMQDIFVTNFAKDYCTMYKNEGTLFFTDISTRLGLKEFTHAQLSWGCAFIDFDLDTKLDLLIVNGHIYPQVDTLPNLQENYKQLPTLLRNVDGKLQDISRQAGPGMQLAESMRGLAVGDYDDDGKLDFLITAMDAPPLLLHDQSVTQRHWVKVRLINRHGSPSINAFAKVTSRGITQSREVRSGSTYCSQNSFDLHFGLDTAELIETVEIRWPSGRSSLERNLKVDQTYTFYEPTDA